jgi:L-alanine-DL-glutamate epimerase-like enolase superfamily enzyme
MGYVPTLMRIDHVSIVVHERPWKLGGIFSVSGDVMPMGVLRIRTDSGLEGNAFIQSPGPGTDVLATQILRFAKPLLMGRDPLDIGAIWQEMWSRRSSLHLTAMGPVDVALWDLAGKAAGMPVHNLLGTVRHKAPSYLSSYVHPESQDYVDEALHYQADGWPGYKLHPPTQYRYFGKPHPSGVGRTVQHDIDACAKIRAAVGDDYMLMLDSAWAYRYDEAVQVGRAIEDLGFYWYEDPLKNDDIHGYSRLKTQLNIEIVATETTEGSVYAMPPWITQRATDVLRGDPILKGGITPLMKIAHLAEAFQMPCEVHDGFNGLGNVACLNVVMAIPNCRFFEVLAFNPTGTYGLDHLQYGLADPIEFDEHRNVLAPTKPGLGHAIDWDRINARVLTTME